MDISRHAIPRVLVVEDERDIRETLAEALAAEGWGVEVAADGAEGLARAHAAHPDLILLDLMMPVMDGLAFLEARRRDADLATTPVLVVTARHPAEVDCEVLYKPFDLDALLAAAHRLLAPAAAPPRA